MQIIEIILIGLGLGMDAFAVAICKGLSMKKMSWQKAIIIGVYFGFFQALMPVLGYCLGSKFQKIVTAIDHWIVFILLWLIGSNMLKESFNEIGQNHNDDISFNTMFTLAIATSIDALAVGITFAFLNVNVNLAAILIGIITLNLSIIGVKIGNYFGDKYEKKAQMMGGTILIIIGVKILLDHLGIL